MIPQQSAYFLASYLGDKPSVLKLDSIVLPLISMILFRLVFPEISRIEFFGKESLFAKNSISITLARPSAGGALSLIFMDSCIHPTISVRFALGITLSERRNGFVVWESMVEIGKMETEIRR